MKMFSEIRIFYEVLKLYHDIFTGIKKPHYLKIRETAIIIFILIKRKIGLIRLRRGCKYSLIFPIDFLF
jgi:hypothetical protein